MPKSRQDEGPLFFRDGIVYREWGYKLASLESYHCSEAYFEKAIEHGQDKNLRTHLGLCKTQVNYARYNRANRTAEKCIEIG